MSDDTDFERASKIFGNDMRVAEKLAVLLNPEVMFSRQQQHKPAAIVDLRRRYDIATEHRPWLHKSEHFRCFDRVSFDPDPEGRWHIYGVGETGNEAMLDLLANIGEEIAKGP